MNMSTQTAEAAKLLSTIFVEDIVTSTAVGIGISTGVLSVVTLWAWLGDRFIFFDLNRTCRRRYD